MKLYAITSEISDTPLRIFKNKEKATRAFKALCRKYKEKEIYSSVGENSAEQCAAIKDGGIWIGDITLHEDVVVE